MKKKILFPLFAFFFLLLSCTDLLEEDIRTQVTKSHLNTAAGFQEAVNGSYASLKTVFCAIEDNGIIPNLTVFGTDVFTNGFDGGYKMMNFYNSDLNPRTNVITAN